MRDEEWLYFNGVNGATGEYGLPQMTLEQMQDRILEIAEIQEDEERKKRFKRDTLKAISTLSDSWLRCQQATQLQTGELSFGQWSNAVRCELEALPIDIIHETLDTLISSKALQCLLDALGEIDALTERSADLIIWLKTVTVDTPLPLTADQFSGSSFWKLMDFGQTLSRRCVGSQLHNAMLETWAATLLTLVNQETSLREPLEQVRTDPCPFITALETVQQANLAFKVSVIPMLQLIREWAGSTRDSALNVYQVKWPQIIEKVLDGLTALTSRPDVPWYDLLPLLQTWLTKLAAEISHLGTVEGVDATKIAEAGWGVIFPAENPLVPQIKEALKPLLEHRQQQTDYFRIFEGTDGFHAHKDAAKFLIHHGAQVHDPVDPEKVPFFLLLVGSPVEIPYQVQFELDVQYAVGRLDFGDDLQAYNTYARSVVEAEKGALKLARRAAFFGVSHDRATQQSAENLIRPLYEIFKEEEATQEFQVDAGDNRYTQRVTWEAESYLAEQATKTQLGQLLGGEQTPALLFTASHGMEFPRGDARQLPDQGALLCQDWKGQPGEVSRDFYFSGVDLALENAPGANLLGMIAFFFACYGAGTPQNNEFARRDGLDRAKIAEQPFIANLPKAMLGHPNGGALAVIGHVERAWSTSFLDKRNRQQLSSFTSCVKHLLRGLPIGTAMDYFNVRYAALSTQLNHRLDEIEWTPDLYSPREITSLWTETKDAEGYIILGDPAVRLPVALEEETPTARYKLEESTQFMAAASRPITQDIPKPDTGAITADDWKHTPLSVKKYIQELNQKRDS